MPDNAANECFLLQHESTIKGIYNKEPSIFKLKISSDGQVVDYQAINQIAVQKYGKHFLPFDLKSAQFPELQKSLYANLKLEMKGVSIRLTPCSETKYLAKGFETQRCLVGKFTSFHCRLTASPTLNP